MDKLYQGYVRTKDKKCIDKFKGDVALWALDDVKLLPEYAGILAEDVILVDIDDQMQSEILMNIVEDYQLNCRVLQTTRGRHFLFYDHKIRKCPTHTTLAIGLTADIKVGYERKGYEVLKSDGKERFVEWDVEDGVDYQKIPKWLTPISKPNVDFLALGDGDGRNTAFFKYILTLTGAGFTMEETRETIGIINKYVLRTPLPQDELEKVLRDGSFQKPVFFNNQGTFLHNVFADYLIPRNHIVKINGQLHIYADGFYIQDNMKIEQQMIQEIPSLRSTQRTEVIKDMMLRCEDVEPIDARYIVFGNGVFDTEDDALKPYSPGQILTNKIKWNYNPEAYCEATDQTLDRIACNDPGVRALLEECIGYCFYRRNEMRKAFILVGGKRNGKSTFLDCVKAVLGNENISALDLAEMGDRFSTAMMFGKLANVGDDIGDDFMRGEQVAMFKKITAGNRVKAERKGEQPFEFEPYVKLLFSANKIPRMKDDTGAAFDRMIIIPFNAVFTKGDPGYDDFIKDKLLTEESMEYLVRLGVEGLHRILKNGFTEPKLVQDALAEYEKENNPILKFLTEYAVEDIINQPTGDVYKWYEIFCDENNMERWGKIRFCRELCRITGLDSVTKKSADRKTYRVFERPK